jgi:hypothetical protein
VLDKFVVSVDGSHGSETGLDADGFDITGSKLYLAHGEVTNHRAVDFEDPIGVERR